MAPNQYKAVVLGKTVIFGAPDFATARIQAFSVLKALARDITTATVV